MLDPELVMDLAGKVSRLKMYPYFDIAHYILSCIAVRDDLATGATLFSRKHPLSCWFSSMVMCFSGIILGSFLLGEPVLAPFKRYDDLILATLVWYFVFYSPFDLMSRLAKLMPFKLSISVLNEVRRAHMVLIGVLHAAKLYPTSYLIMIIVGTARGSGSAIMRTMEQLIRGIWMPSNNEMLRPRFTTKACVLASLVFVLERKGGIVDMPHDILYTGVVAFLVYFRFSSIILNIHDPFHPIENLFCAVFMGGIWDALSRAIAASRERRAGMISDQVIDEGKKVQ